MQTKSCFKCKLNKPLDEFPINKRSYQLKSDLGRCITCWDCEEAKAINDLSVIRLNFETNKFDIIKFENEQEAMEFIKKERDEKHSHNTNR